MPFQAEADGSRREVPGSGPHGVTHLGLAHLAPKRFLSTATTALYRHIARLVELDEDLEFLVVPSGRGLTVQLLSELTGASGAGVDPDPTMVDAAIERARAARLTGRLHYEVAPVTDLPYQDAVFDVVIGEIGLGAAEDLGAAIRELARVVRPMGTVVLIQFTWTGSVEPERREAVAESLGVRPHLLVECKQLMRDAGLVDLYVEDWSDVGGGRHPWPVGVLTDTASLRDRATVVWRAWRQWGWDGVRAALRSGAAVRDLITRDRILGLSVIKGVRWQEEESSSSDS